MKERKFYILGPLMSGGMSRAFLGQELSPSGRLRPVVMIFLPEELVADQETFERIRTETRIAVRLDHFNIITLLGLARMEDGYARIVEYADAESMRSVLNRAHEVQRAIPPAVTATILADASAGVHYAHEMGVSEHGRPLLHMAVRPQTLLVTFKGVGMVTGYGAATIAEGVLQAQGFDASIRDPYTAPEQAYGGRKAATVQTDVFALGAVLFEALTGRAPFESPLTEADSEQEILMSRLGDTPRALAEIAVKALARHSRERFASVSDLREALLDQPETATKREVAAFMEELFPPDMPQIKARRTLLQRGQHDHDTQPPPPDGRVSSANAASTVWRYPLEDEKTPTDLPLVQAPAQPAKATSQAEPPEPVPQAKPVPELPIAPPVQVERKVIYPPAPPPQARTRRTHPAVYVSIALVVVLAFVVGLLFSGVLTDDPPAPQVIQLQPLDAKPVPPAVAGRQPATSASVAPAHPEVPPPEKKKVKSSSIKRRRTGGIKRRRNREQDRDTSRKLLAPPSVGRSTTGYLTIEAPPGSKVYVRGKFKGITPMKKLVLPVGKHKVRVEEKDTNNKYSHIVPIGAGQDLTLTVDFY